MVQSVFLTAEGHASPVKMICLGCKHIVTFKSIENIGNHINHKKNWNLNSVF